MIVWFWCQIGFPLSVVTSLISLCFLIFFVIFPNAALFIKSKKSFSKSLFAFFLRSVFTSIYRFTLAFWLNSITLWTFFKINSWFNACFKFFMCITYLVWSCRLATNFSIFSFFLVKMVNHYEVHLIFQGIGHQLQKTILHLFLHCSFFMKSLLNRELYFIYWKLLRHCTTILIIYISILLIWQFFFFIIIFHLFVISFCISINRVT